MGGTDPPTNRQEPIMFAHRITKIVTAIGGGALILVSAAGRDLLHFVGDDVHPIVSFKDLPGVMSDINETTKGPVRDAVVQTACDAVENGDYNTTYEWRDLGKNLAIEIQPRGKQFLDTVKDLAGNLSEAENRGLTTPEAVATACDAYSIRGTLG
jgi:hypothetical protein